MLCGGGKEFMREQAVQGQNEEATVRSGKL